MQAALQTTAGDRQRLRSAITAALDHLDHVLPGQAPLHDFVHHNTLHGFQHLPFEEALEKFAALTGISGYLPEAEFRHFHRQGRISGDDLNAALADVPGLEARQNVLAFQDRTIARLDIYRVALLFDLSAISPSQLNWQIEELDALNSVQPDVPASVRNQLLAYRAAPDNPIRRLWECIITTLGLRYAALHPENMLDLSIEQAEEWLDQALPNRDSKLRKLFGTSIRQQNQRKARLDLDELLEQVGDAMTLRGVVLMLGGIDILDSVRPQLIRICASALDEGMAPWQLPERGKLGFYPAWRATLLYDANPFLHELPDWRQIVMELPDDPVDAIILQLTRLEIPVDRWDGYLRRLALELPGWSGLINWRQHHPNYFADNDASPQLADYLAIRLTLDRLWLNQVCRILWRIEAKPSSLHGYFSKNLPEFFVRKSLYQGNLPEYLTELAESLVAQTAPERRNRHAWEELAELIWTWQLSPMTEDNARLSVYNTGWRLFRLFQHLGLNDAQVQQLSRDDLLRVITLLDGFNVTERGKIWLNAYERNYREAFFHALRNNHNRGRWAKREQPPETQIIFCMDDREESFRRHLEELNPAIETLGAAGFFGIAMNYRGLDDVHSTPLCPVVVTPEHEVREAPEAGNEPTLARHVRGLKFRQAINYLLHQGLRRNLLTAYLTINAVAPVTLLGLLAKSLLPTPQQRFLAGLTRTVSPEPKTRLRFTAAETSPVNPPNRLKPGFTDGEQADRIAGFLRNIGLTDQFSKLIVLMGHGSSSQNNPHRAAYDCGACSGRHGGPNARVFAAMANRPEIRRLLRERNIIISADTWFIGAEHNTCNEEISWYDLDDIPATHRAAFAKLVNELVHARRMSAHERCRRLASAPRKPSPAAALSHIEERADDFSQARPELGHATNASAIVGRRSLSQGVFFDRRVFLISYDPTQDPEGKILEGILLAVGPVGAGINLEYYFSTVNNERFGCSSKLPHNITGFLGVMDGAASDLRTGLPRQMVEIHEAMRLQILVEAKTTILERIYADQPDLRELIAGGWVHLSTKDPDTGEIHVFQRGLGFVPWRAETKDLPIYDKSPECYRNQTLPVAPVLIKQPDVAGL